MSHLLKYFFYFMILGGLLISCFPPQEEDIVPTISFNNIRFSIAEGNFSDSLILTLNFKDGDGDVGLDPRDDNPPYHAFWFVRDNNREFVTLNGEFTPPFFLYTQDGNQDIFIPFSETDNRPEFNCQNYFVDELVDSEGPTGVIDTFYIEKNINNNNIFVDFFRKQGPDYEFIDWTSAFSTNNCGLDFNARFPIFEDNINGRTLEGTIRYAMVSEGFTVVLREDTIKLRIFIKDRALNDSNIIESPDFTLEGISN